MIDSDGSTVDTVLRNVQGGHIKEVYGVRDMFPASSSQNKLGRRVPGKLFLTRPIYDMYKSN